MESAYSGINALGDVKWGSHFCHFYHGEHDLIDTLVPYFKAGLENNEKCLWITSDPLDANDARTLLKKVVPKLDTLEQSGQIEIYNYQDWYLKTGTTDTDATIKSWVDRQSQALENGFSGLRLTGNTYWLERKDWQGFAEYEHKVNQTFSQHRIIGLCSYCLQKTGSTDVFDVVRNHDFALLRQGGNWELLETAQVKESKDELRKLNSDLKTNLKKSLDEAESANRLKTSFLANMSHEIRTPLGAILGFTELLRDRELSAAEKEIYTETVHRNGKALSKLIDDILDLSKIEADRLETEKVPFSLPNLMNEVTALFVPKVQEKCLSLRVELAKDLPTMLVSDPARIRQILLNLVGNALKFTEKGEILVKVGRAETKNQIRFEINDSGIGIDDDGRESLFLPFMQADGSMTRKFGGTGLGLYLSRRLARVLGGDVVLERSEPGHGSTFIATITCYASEAKAPQPATDARALEPGVLQGMRILIVDDTFDNQLLVSRMLKSTGAKIGFAKDGQEGIDRANSEEFDVILMDLQMPNVDGYEATHRLRESGFDKPIIALTAHAMKEERDRALKSGFDDHVAKPVDRSKLVNVLQSYRAAVCA